MATYVKSEAQDWAWENLRGEWSTLMTPFTPDDEVDDDALRHNIRHVISLGTRGAGCTWGMGEFWSLTREERIRVYDTFADEAAGTVAHRRSRHPHLRKGDALSRRPRRERGLRPPHRRPALLRHQDRVPGRRLHPTPGRLHQPRHHVLQLSPVRHRHERRRAEPALRHSQTSSASRRPASTATSPSRPTGCSATPRSSAPRRVGPLQGPRARLPAAGHVRQHLRLALRPSQARTTTSNSSTAPPRATSTTPCTSSASRPSRPSPTSGGSTPSPSSAARSPLQCASIGASSWAFDTATCALPCPISTTKKRND